MGNELKLRQCFWVIILGLFLVPLCNSLLININKLFVSVSANNQYKVMLNKLDEENTKLSDKVRYYKSLEGTKALIKDRLNKVEEGESIIKFNNKSD